MNHTTEPRTESWRDAAKALTASLSDVPEVGRYPLTESHYVRTDNTGGYARRTVTVESVRTHETIASRRAYMVSARYTYNGETLEGDAWTDTGVWHYIVTGPRNGDGAIHVAHRGDVASERVMNRERYGDAFGREWAERYALSGGPWQAKSVDVGSW